ncbi:MAG: DTW domain-containing protein [Elusimicrobiales bacterium]|nr:DTW domain-containing protein [Elusimicrobiales bacterium]
MTGLTGSANAAASHREECYACRRPKKNCLCGSAKPFATRTRFVILMHDKEAHKQRTGTARLARMCLKNSELLVGTDFSRNERVNALIKDPAYVPFVLYPGPEALNFKTLGPAAFPAGKTLLVFVIDGTWRGAQRILKKSHNVRALPRLSFWGNYVSQFKIKKQPLAHCVSTIEAVYYLCCEGEAAGYERLDSGHEVLMAVFKELVDAQLGYQAGRRRRREENGARA